MNIRIVKVGGVAFGLAVAALLTPGRADITFNSPAFITQSQIGSLYGGNASPISITYAGNKFVGSGGYSSANQLFQTGLNGQSISLFGAPMAGASGEIIVGASPNVSAFGSNDIYSGSGANANIFKFSNDGSTQSLFATLPSLAGSIRGLGFDTSGLYGDDMIVTTTSGNVYKVDSSGSASVLAALGTDTEGVSFATQQFGTYAAGTLFTTSESTGFINAIAPDGTVSHAFTVGGAESISFVPAGIAGETNPIEGFYGVNYPYNVLFAGASQFDPYAGQVIVTSENQSVDGKNIFAVALDASNAVTIAGIGFMNQPEDSIFVTQESVISHGAPDGGSAAAMFIGGLLCLGALAFAGRSRVASRVPPGL